MRYADPALCPDCRSDLPATVDRCPTCDLVVRHDLAVQLFATLTRADGLLAALRTASAPTSSPVSSPAAPPPPPRLTQSAPSAPSAQSAPTPVRPVGMSTASVPRILLGLGALCLLVAACVFLAVSWAALGVGGRTAVLVGLTLTAGGLTLGLLRADLRVAAEALGVVTLGLVALDVLGAGTAGWLPALDGDVLVTLVGGVVALVALALGLVAPRGHQRLLSPQIAVGIAVLITYAGLVAATGHPLLVGQSTVALIIVAVLVSGLSGRSHHLSALRWSLTGAGVVAWSTTGLVGAVDVLADPSMESLWVEGDGWSLLLTAAAALAPAAMAPILLSPDRASAPIVEREGIRAGATVAALIATATVCLPSLDEGARVLGVVALCVSAGWCLLLALLPQRARVIATVPALAGAALLLVQLALGTLGAAARWLDAARTSDGVLADSDLALRRPEPWIEPLLLVPSALVVLVLVALLVRADRGPAGALIGLTGLAGVGMSAVITLASYDVALVAPLTLLGTLALAVAALAARADGTTGMLGALLAGGLAVLTAGAALPGAALALGGGIAATVVAIGLALLARTSLARGVGGMLAPAATGVVACAVVALVGLGDAWIAVPVLVVGGVLTLVLPRPEVGASALVTALVVLPVAVDAASQPARLSALWLVVAGMLLVAGALLHQMDRRALAGAGVCWLVASWVWLGQAQVAQPEAYTLPAAIVLAVLGCVRLQRDAATRSIAALAPGLLLGLLPSLAWAMAEPLSLRALLVGAACLTLTLLGAALRLSAPLVIGAVAGAVLAVRELAPYAGTVPQWVWIGLAGAVLTIVGITWERRLREVRSAVGVLARLR